jgi:hypothetical protein
MTLEMPKPPTGIGGFDLQFGQGRRRLQAVWAVGNATTVTARKLGVPVVLSSPNDPSAT